MVRRRVGFYGSAFHIRRIIVMQIASIGIDLGKTTFHLVALGEHSKILLRKKFSRTQLLAYTANLPASLIGLEACAGAHFLGAALREQGHQVRLIPAQFVKPYRKSNKNDFIDAEAIAEAVTKQNMRFAQIKTQDQLDWQAMHRVRGSVGAAAHRTDQRDSRLPAGTRYHLRDSTHSPAQESPRSDRRCRAEPEPAVALAAGSAVARMETDRQRRAGDHRIEIERISNEDARCRQLREIPGFGPLVSTATVAAIGNGAAFRRGRDFAAWVGVVPRQYSTGGKQRLYGISKRGNIYLRRMLIHGARAVLFRIKHDTGGFGQWVHRLAQRAPHNKVVVAIANKLARIAWAVLSSGRNYRHQPLQPVAA
jgi:transposase